MYLGIDIGGTFTDLVLMDDEGTLRTAKALSTPGELELGVFNAIQTVAQSCEMTPNDLLRRVKVFGHGTTQATNALIERDGARTALITTAGFGDTLSMQRLMGFTAGLSVDQLRAYSRRRYPEPLVPRTLIGEVHERIDRAGNVLRSMDEEEVRDVVSKLIKAGAQTFAICLLWGFKNPVHERRIEEIISDMAPGTFVSVSSKIAPVVGEYERTATTAMNSYLALKVVSYLRRIESKLRERGFSGQFNILNSAGGVVPAAEAAEKPVLLVASGPTGGVMGSVHLAASIGEKNIITTDMGGTSFDVALIVDGKPIVSSSQEAGGYHLATPMVEIRAIGAGGGSIASVRNGLLTVGPESAGASPGPACYARGGNRPTVTDANVVLGILPDDNFLGGAMKLDRAAAEKTIREHVADPLGITVEQAASGIRRIVDSHMADTLRELTIGRGYDPRDFVLLSYGGAGPAHCASYGAELGVSRIVVPSTSMAHSAYGAMASDIQSSHERSLLLFGGGGHREPWDGIDPQVLAETLCILELESSEAMQRAGVPSSGVHIERTVGLRYRRQTNSLFIPLPAGDIDGGAIRRLIEHFEQAYETIYGEDAGFRAAGVELTSLRLSAIGGLRKPQLGRTYSSAAVPNSSRKVFDPEAGQFVMAELRSWNDLPEDEAVQGPIIVLHPETTVWVGSRQAVTRDKANNLSITAKAPRQ